MCYFMAFINLKVVQSKVLFVDSFCLNIFSQQIQIGSYENASRQTMLDLLLSELPTSACEK